MPRRGRRPMQSPDGWASTPPTTRRTLARWTSPPPDGCWSVPTDSGTTARSRASCRRWCRSRRTARARIRSAWLPHWSTGPTCRAGLTTSLQHSRVSIHLNNSRKARTMATFSAEVYQNEFLPDGGSDVHAIVTVTCEGAGEAGRSGSGDAGEIVIVDTSGSMVEDKITAAKHAAAAALDQVLDGVWFAVVAGNHEARLAYPIAAEPGMVRMDDRTRAEAKRAIGDFQPGGGTAMGTWLWLATQVFASVPGLAQKHAI